MWNRTMTWPQCSRPTALLGCRPMVWFGDRSPRVASQAWRPRGWGTESRWASNGARGVGRGSWCRTGGCGVGTGRGVGTGDGPGESTGKTSLANANGVSALSPGLDRITRTYPGNRGSMQTTSTRLRPMGDGKTAMIRTAAPRWSATALRLVWVGDTSPRVASEARQPWAGGRNPVGIQMGRDMGMGSLVRLRCWFSAW